MYNYNYYFYECVVKCVSYLRFHKHVTEFQKIVRDRQQHSTGGGGGDSDQSQLQVEE